MKLKNIVVLSLLGVYGGITVTSINTNCIYASSQKVDYPNIKSKYDVNNMSQYSDDDLDQYVTMKKFYVQGISYDRHHQERIIFTNTPQSKDYYFTVLHGNKHHKHLAVGDSVTIKGAVEPRETLEKSPANKAFDNKFFGKQMIFVLTDSYK